MLQNDIKAKIF